MKKHCLSAGFLLFLSSLVCAQAQQTLGDLVLSSTNSDINIKTGVSIFQGDVVLTQGQSKLYADYLEVHTNAKRQFTEAIAKAKPGMRVRFTTVVKPNEPLLTAMADVMYYYPLENKLSLRGQADLTQGKDRFQAPIMDIDTKNQQISSKADQNQRTVILISQTALRGKK